MLNAVVLLDQDLVLVATVYNINTFKTKLS